MEVTPPKWADRFLAWYCNPDLLEEIQGDAHELYSERLKHNGKRYADWKYTWDIIRFCRWSNIRRRNENQPGYLSILWNLNFKIALRNAQQNKLLYAIKVFGLAICLTFSLVISSFIIHEFSYDQHHQDHDRIFRIGLSVNLGGNVTHYAVSPIGMGNSVAEEIPEVENACWIFYSGRPLYSVEGEQFNNETTLIASPEFLKILTFEFTQGNSEALDDPNKIVLTETTARKFFGRDDAMGRTIEINETLLEVAAVIKDLPPNSHLKFDALISWNTYDIDDSWSNVNGYTYVKLRDGVNVSEAHEKISNTFAAHREDMDGISEYINSDNITLSPYIENISDIHLAPYLNEDIAQKRNRTNLFILVAVVLVFFITGLINFLNLSLAELTANFRKIGILQVFGGSNANHNKVTYTNSFFTFITVVPLTFILGYCCLTFGESYLSIKINRTIFSSNAFMLIAILLIATFVFSAKINSFILSRSNSVINALKGKLNSTQNGFHVRELMVAAQLAFSMIIIALIVVIVDQFQFINTTDKGFDEKNTIVVKMRGGDYVGALAFSESAKQLSGVKNVDGTSFYLDNVETKEFFEVHTNEGNKKMLVKYISCGYDYLNTMQIRIIKGRNFDRDHATDNRGAYIVNEAAAKEFGWKDPLGKIINGPFGTDRGEGEVIGLVKDFHVGSLHDPIEPLIIFLINEGWGMPYMFIKLAPVHDPALISAIEKEYKTIFPDMPFEWEYLDAKYASLYLEDMEMRNIFQVGLTISILVSCMGIFSLSALLLVMRSREMGIRKIVGAARSHLLLLHVRAFVKPVVVALVIACPAIFFLADQWLENFAYHIDLNVWHFAIPGLVALVMILGTSAYHGIKNALVNPIEIIRHE